MGCVQAKPSLNSPPRGSSGGGGGSLDKMKTANGYMPARRSTGGSNRFSRPNSRERPMQRVSSRQSLSETSGSSRDQREAVEQENKVAPLPLPVPIPYVVPPVALARARRDLEEEEMVDGWPKWLTDNIPREVLSGLIPKSADSYDKLAKVGQGTYSNVYKARDRDTGKIVALKKVRFDTSETESVKFMAREIMILQKLDHPNIIKLEGLATSRMQYSLYLVFDFMLTDLSKVISRPEGRLTEPQVKCYMNQLLSGLQHCHERGILHRDIKGSNLLIDKHGMLKIGDFGLANYFDPKKKRPLTSRVVTLWYRAPELLLGTTDYGVGIDLWSAGCLLAEMFAGRPIMPGRTEVEQLHRIFKLCGSPSEEYWRKLRISTSLRPAQPYKSTIVETFRDFPLSSLGLLKALLALDPALRGSAASALQNEFFTTSPLACELSGLPIVYKPDEDEAILPRRKRKSSRLKQRSRTQKEGQRNVDDILIPKGDPVFTKEEKPRVRATYSYELGSSATGSTSSGEPAKKYYVKSPSLSSAGSLPENAGRQRIHSHESSRSGGQAYSYYVSSPPSLSPVSSPLFGKTGSQVTTSDELNTVTTGSPFSGHDEITTEGHPSATRNIKNKPPHYSSNANPNRANGVRYGMEKRSISTTGYRTTDKKEIPKRYVVG